MVFFGYKVYSINEIIKKGRKTTWENNIIILL